MFIHSTNIDQAATLSRPCPRLWGTQEKGDIAPALKGLPAYERRSHINSVISGGALDPAWGRFWEGLNRVLEVSMYLLGGQGGQGFQAPEPAYAAVHAFVSLSRGFSVHVPPFRRCSRGRAGSEFHTADVHWGGCEIPVCTTLLNAFLLHPAEIPNVLPKHAGLNQLACGVPR